MAVTRSIALAFVFACALIGCVIPQPCGWDEVLTVDASYDVELLEAYTTASTMAVYRPEHDLTRPAPTCAGLGDVMVGDVWTIRVLEPQSSYQDCSFYQGEITSPPVDLGTPFTLLINNRSHNQIVVSGRQDFGAGCEGLWEFSVHAPGNDPFRAQNPTSRPVVLGYRVFETTPEVGPACSALIGSVPSLDGFRCGDAFVASMTPVP